ncbi:MAG: decaprenyl-phosphate phosphoribosyltransferase [bacterium]
MNFRNTLPYQLIRAVRPRQWIKNLSLFAAILFAGKLFDPYFFYRALAGVILFSMLSSAAYLVNDIVDAKKDRLHPYKKQRPIASGKLSPATAVVCAAVLATLALYGAWALSPYFLASLLLYMGLNLFYSFYFRNIIILDALMIAAGFILRVFAGSLIDLTSMSSWLILTTIGVSLLIAFGKRQSEKTILKREDVALETRKTLRHYPDKLLDSMIMISASLTLTAYSLFAFQAGSQPALGTPLAKILPATLLSPKWMMLTIPFVIYGLGRYLYVIYEKQGGESPERVLMSDYPLLLAVCAWFVTILGIIYLL